MSSRSGQVEVTIDVAIYEVRIMMLVQGSHCMFNEARKVDVSFKELEVVGSCALVGQGHPIRGRKKGWAVSWEALPNTC